MKNQTRLTLAVQFFMGFVALLNGLLQFGEVSSYTGLENNFLAENWGIPLTFALAVAFCMGWWFESFIENLILVNGRKIAIFAWVGGLLMIFAVVVGSLFFIHNGFFKYSISSIGFVLISGSFFHFSVIRPEVLAKLQKRG